MGTNEMEDRRKDPGSQALVVLINSLSEQLRELRAEMAELKKTGAFSHTINDDALAKAIKHAMEVGFPDGDAELHRRAHEAQIKAAEDRSKMYITLRTEVAKYGLLGLIGWLFVMAWQGFLQGPR